MREVICSEVVLLQSTKHIQKTCPPVFSLWRFTESECTGGREMPAFPRLTPAQSRSTVGGWAIPSEPKEKEGITGTSWNFKWKNVNILAHQKKFQIHTLGHIHQCCKVLCIQDHSSMTQIFLWSNLKRLSPSRPSCDPWQVLLTSLNLTSWTGLLFAKRNSSSFLDMKATWTWYISSRTT